MKFDWFRAAPALFLLLWSSGYSFVRVGLRYSPPLTLLTLRYAAALIVLVPILALVRPPWPRRMRDWAHLAAVGLLIQYVYFGLAIIAIGQMSVALVTLILSLQPVVVAILAPVLANERVGRRGWIGLLLGLAGAAMVILARGPVTRVSTGGIVAALLALLGMVAGTLLEKRAPRPQHPLAASTVQYAVGLAATLPTALLVEQMQVDWSVPFAVSLAYLVLGNSLLAMMLLLAMIRRGAVAGVSALFFLVPPVAALIAWASLGETLKPAAWGGMALAASGVALVSRRKAPKEGVARDPQT